MHSSKSSLLGRALLALAAYLGAAAAHAQITIGQVAPFSGPQAVTGRAIHAGAKLYIDAVNAGGGVRGQHVRFVTRDDAQQTEATVRLVKELIRTEAPVALLGTVGTSNLEALIKDGVLSREGVPMVGAISGAASVAQAEQMVVVKAGYRDEIDKLFASLALVGIRRVGIVYQEDGLGQDVLAGADIAAKRHGVELVARAGYARNTTDTSAPVARMLEAAPQAVLLGATTAAAIDFMRRYRTLGGSAQIYGMSIIDTEAMLKALGSEQVRGYAFTAVFPLALQKWSAVVREFELLRAASADANLSARSIEGFIAAKTLVWALQRAPRPTASAIHSALAAPGGFDAGGFSLDFSRKGRSGSRWVDFAMLGAGGRVMQ